MSNIAPFNKKSKSTAEIGIDAAVPTNASRSPIAVEPFSLANAPLPVYID